jgi:tetratricopeptide (TPR) repeat protein
MNPNYFEAFLNRGLAKETLKDSLGAIQDLTKAIELNPLYIEAYYERGILKTLIGQKEEGSADIKKARMYFE